MTNLNILDEYKRCNETAQSITVDEAEAVINFCKPHGTEVIFLVKNGEVSQYFMRAFK